MQVRSVQFDPEPVLFPTDPLDHRTQDAVLLIAENVADRAIGCQFATSVGAETGKIFSANHAPQCNAVTHCGQTVDARRPRQSGRLALLVASRTSYS
jgi:hypothetical protein